MQVFKVVQLLNITNIILQRLSIYLCNLFITKLTKSIVHRISSKEIQKVADYKLSKLSFSQRLATLLKSTRKASESIIFSEKQLQRNASTHEEQLPIPSQKKTLLSVK